MLEHSEIIVHGRFLSVVSACWALIPPPPPPSSFTRTRMCFVAAFLLLCTFKLLMRLQCMPTDAAVLNVGYTGEAFSIYVAEAFFLPLSAGAWLHPAEP